MLYMGVMWIHLTIFWVWENNKHNAWGFSDQLNDSTP